MLNFEKHSEQALLNYLNHLGNRDAVLTYQQIQGLLYAMACSPEPIKPVEWFELIWLSDDPCFDDVAEAKAFYRLLVDLFHHIGDLARRDLYSPGFDANGRFSPAALADWCEGFLMGHQYLENIWVMALEDLNDERLYDRVEATLDWAIAFVERDAPNWSSDEGDEGLQAGHLQFQHLLASYCAVHRLWFRDSAASQVEQVFEAMQAVGRDEPCPCGSARIFEQCCLH